MKRRQFIEPAAGFAGLLSLGAFSAEASHSGSEDFSAGYPDLEKNIIGNDELVDKNCRWPRLSGFA